jgi:hypothetical protein
MPLPECSVLWPTNRAEKGIDAVKKAAIDAKIVDLTEETAKKSRAARNRIAVTRVWIVVGPPRLSSRTDRRPK